MPGSIRPNKVAMKIAYNLLKTPKERRQYNNRKPDAKRINEWFRDSSTTQ